jgi:hypothetical protein
VAQFIHQYTKALLDGQAVAAQQLGVTIYGVDRTSYVINLSVLTLIGVVMKQISAVAPQVTDQVWIDALTHALDADQANPWPADMLNQVNPNPPI